MREAGFECEAVFDSTRGEPVADGADTRDAFWFHYVARKAGTGHDYGGFDGTLTISEDVAEQSVYGGYDIDYDLIPELHRAVPNQHIFLGVRLIVSEHLSFFVEGGYGLKRPDIPLYLYVSGGPSLTF